MGYHYGHYRPPPHAPVLPAALDAALPLPAPASRESLRLPPAPADAARRSELGLVHELVAARTPAGDAWARYMDARGASSMWWGAAQRLHANGSLLRSLE